MNIKNTQDGTIEFKGSFVKNFSLLGANKRVIVQEIILKICLKVLKEKRRKRKSDFTNLIH